MKREKERFDVHAHTEPQAIGVSTDQVNNNTSDKKRQLTDLDKMRADKWFKGEEVPVNIKGVWYIVFAEWEQPDQSVGYSGGPAIAEIYRPTGEEVTSYIADWVEDAIYITLGDMYDEAEKLRKAMLKEPGLREVI